jgi:signal peptidase I
MDINLKEYLYSKSSIPTLIRVAIFLLGLVVLSYNTVRVFKTDGPSMNETYTDGEHLFVNTRAYDKEWPERYDVVMVIDVNNLFFKDEFMVKRIIALPGETVEIDNGIIYINGVERADDIWKARGVGVTGPEFYDGEPVEAYGESTLPITLTAYEYFIIGDNRGITWYGVYSFDEFVGKVIN